MVRKNKIETHIAIKVIYDYESIPDGYFHSFIHSLLRESLCLCKNVISVPILKWISSKHNGEGREQERGMLMSINAVLLATIQFMTYVCSSFSTDELLLPMLLWNESSVSLNAEVFFSRIFQPHIFLLKELAMQQCVINPSC